MTNPLKGEAKLQLDDGRSFTLVLDHEGLFAAEDLARKPLEMLLDDVKAGMLGARRAVLYGALRRHHGELTPEDATQIMIAGKMKVVEAIGAAFEAAMPPKAEGDNAGNGKKRPAGKRSGRSGAKRD